MNKNWFLIQKLFINKGFLAFLLFCIVLSIFIFCLDKPDESRASFWYNDDWHYRKKITIDPDKVPNADQTDFPLLVSFTTDSDLVDHVEETDGSDFLFTDYTGIELLDFEIEYFDSTSGKLAAWVKMPEIFYQDYTYLYIYYGNDAGSLANENPTSLWSDYKMVQHMNEDPSGTPPQIIDSTTNNNDGTTGGTMTDTDLIDTKIGQGLDLDGSNDTINFSNDSSQNLTTTITFGGWFKIDTVTGSSNQYYSLLGKTGGSGGADDFNYMLYFRNSVRKIRPHLVQSNSTNKLYDSNGTLTAGEWYHIMEVGDGTNLNLYINGSLDTATITYDGTIDTIDGNLSAGLDTRTSQGVIALDGDMDELRLTGEARDANWIAMEYANQNSPSTFYSVGAEQPNTKIEYSDMGAIASVTDGLKFDIVDFDDPFTDTNVCNIGSLTVGQVASCHYRIGAGTNAGRGMVVYINDISSNIGMTANSGSDRISDVTDYIVDGSGSAEEYGFIVSSVPNGLSVSGTYGTNEQAVPAYEDAIISSSGTFEYTKGVSYQTSIIDHKAIIDAYTEAGYYTQTLQYIIVGKF